MEDEGDASQKVARTLSGLGGPRVAPRVSREESARGDEVTCDATRDQSQICPIMERFSSPSASGETVVVIYRAAFFSLLLSLLVLPLPVVPLPTGAMVKLSLVSPMGNQGVRYFPHKGYLGLTPLRFEGRAYSSLPLSPSLTPPSRPHTDRAGRQTHPRQRRRRRSPLLRVSPRSLGLRPDQRPL